ncbi:helix-turn-helix transcriptional regulator [Spartinivicinus poritis]|uniref:Helix-turn-helix transcriptional regulator n=1 Tax=Spartinivicinus poritis TaxID=2994640 RepID=A0ABT5UIJ7_9GAMM|nr:helix-turn-helix transcriptional regulator [Spartinivicinus sp. A2-2]MDE1466035.1 helix-turn-helix transcriptional regulator [Spartinivicinus sp. A2-2]
MITTDGHWQAHLDNPHLAPRETEYCLGLLSGKTDKIIAREQGVEPGTVSNRIKNVHYKLKTANRAHLVAELIRLKIVTLNVSPLVMMLLAVFVVNSVPIVVNDNPDKPRQVRIVQRTGRRPEYLPLDNNAKGDELCMKTQLYIS